MSFLQQYQFQFKRKVTMLLGFDGYLQSIVVSRIFWCGLSVLHAFDAQTSQSCLVLFKIALVPRHSVQAQTEASRRQVSVTCRLRQGNLDAVVFVCIIVQD